MAVRFKLDENLPKDAGALLLAAGHDVETVLDERLRGNPDAKILDACQVENRVLITFDLDFSDIRLYPPSSHKGIWILRPHTQSVDNTLALLKGALELIKSEVLQARLWIVEPDQVRIRE
jgi:predicted nuclease of predicted toxin-antitoxin system